MRFSIYKYFSVFVLLLTFILCLECHKTKSSKDQNQRDKKVIKINKEIKPIQENEKVIDPAKMELNNWATSLGYQINVYSQPSEESKIIGYIRWGKSIRVTDGIKEERRCTWRYVEGGGFICTGKKIQVGKSPAKIRTIPFPPDINEPLPYIYIAIRRNETPLFRRIPSQIELMAEREQEKLLIEAAQMENADPAAQNSSNLQIEQSENTEQQNNNNQTENEQTEKRTEVAQQDSQQNQNEEIENEQENSEEQEEEQEEEAEEEEGERNTLIVQRLNRGFFLTADKDLKRRGMKYYRTVKGFFVEYSRAIQYKNRGTFEGIDLNNGIQVPVGFMVSSRGYWREIISGKNIRVLRRQSIERLTPFLLLSKILIAGQYYWNTKNGGSVAENEIAVITSIPRPSGIGENEKWIDVNITKQTLTAYEGDVPVFATLVSTGKEGHETPIGRFTINSKHITSTMDDVPVDDDPYLIEDVPWTMYFHLNNALHGAFWHRSFGRRKSHGCVNLSPADARWVFNWVNPQLPSGWHGVYSSEQNLGTTVYIHE